MLVSSIGKQQIKHQNMSPDISLILWSAANMLLLVGLIVLIYKLISKKKIVKG
jgi:hypothetical protein